MDTFIGKACCPPEKALATLRPPHGEKYFSATVHNHGASFGLSTVSGFLPSHKVLKDGALSCTLAAHHSDLGQVKVADMPHAAQGVLQTVDQRDKILHPLVAHRNGAATFPAPLPDLSAFVHSFYPVLLLLATGMTIPITETKNGSFVKFNVVLSDSNGTLAFLTFAGCTIQTPLSF